MTTEKILNYTDAQTTQAVQDYARGVSVEVIAESLGKSVRSVVAKLVREKVYVPKTAVKPARVTKSALIAKISGHLGIASNMLESLEKANLVDLEVLEANILTLYRENEMLKSELETAP